MKYRTLRKTAILSVLSLVLSSASVWAAGDEAAVMNAQADVYTNEETDSYMNAEITAADPIATDAQINMDVKTGNTEQELLVEETCLPDETFEEDLLEGYILLQFYGSPEISLFSNSHCGDTLSGQTKAFYDALTPLIRQVASGQISSTIFNFDSSVIMEKNQKSAAELGVSQVTEENVKDLAASLVSYDSRILINSLLADMPYELYWFNKMSGGMKISYTIGYTSAYVRIKQFKVSFAVVPDYQGADLNTVDSTRAASIGTSVSNAKAIIQQAAGLSDLEKIRFYKDKICDLTEYNYDAAAGYPGGYGEPWQLVYVFDGDPSTNVVCEGYAKAFQYLMDETVFSSGEIYSFLVTGTKSGGKHMWNILHMDDSRNYMVDVTAADSYRSADPSHRFLEIPDSGDVANGYRYEDKTLNHTIIHGADYKYDADTSSLYSDQELTLTDTEYGKDPVPTLYVNKKDGSEKSVTLLAKNIQKPGSDESIRVAVWSEKNGQDDLKWYEMQFSSADDAFKTDVPITKHRTTGLYYAHLYHCSATGKMTYLAENTFEIHPVSAEDLQVQIDSKDPSKAVATIYGVTCPSGVTEVVFPTWCKTDQSDLVWYKGNKISEGVYQVTIDAAKHKNESGTYKIHVYGTSGIDVQNFLLNSSCELKVKGPELQALQNSVGYTLKISSLNTGDVKEVRYAIWSSKNGQDDLKWINTTATSGTASISWNPAETGNHYIHVYVKTTSGQMIFQKGMELNVPAPSIDSMTAAADNSNGNFRLTVKGLKSPSAIRTVKIAVWNDAKQKDLIWYKAVKQADGSYTVDSNIAKHDYRTGTYHAHLYIEDTRGGMKFAGAQDFDCVCSYKSLTAALSADKTKAVLSAKGLSLPFEVDHMSYAVWSETGGQDDLRWYDGPVHAGASEVSINVAGHKSSGVFQVHMYAFTRTGRPVYVGKTTFTV